MSDPLFPVVIDVTTEGCAVMDSLVPQWYVMKYHRVTVIISLSPSVDDYENISWTFIPSNSNNLNNVVDIAKAPTTSLYILATDRLQLVIKALTSNEEGNYTIAVLDNLVTSTKTISLNILRKQIVFCVWHSEHCLVLLSNVCFYA